MQESFDELCKHIESKDNKAWASFRALGHKDDIQSLKKLIELYLSPDWCYRRMAIEGLSYHSLGSQAFDTIRKALHDSSAYVVRRACHASSQLKLSMLHDDIKKLLQSPDAYTRQVVLQTLCEIWQKTDFDEMKNVFLKEKNEKTRREAAWTLRKTVTAETCRQIFSLFWKDDVPRHRTWACELASMFGAQEVKNELDLLSKDKNGHVRKAAMKAIGSSKKSKDI